MKVKTISLYQKATPIITNHANLATKNITTPLIYVIPSAAVTASKSKIKITWWFDKGDLAGHTVGMLVLQSTSYLSLTNFNVLNGFTTQFFTTINEKQSFIMTDFSDWDKATYPYLIAVVYPLDYIPINVRTWVQWEYVAYKDILAKIQEPSVQAKSWYQMNTNHTLENIITFRGEIDDFKKYDAVKIGSNTYYLTGLTANGDKSLRGEIGI